MKKLVAFFMFLLVLTGCSKDDQDDMSTPDRFSLTGSYQVYSIDLANCSEDYQYNVEFSSDDCAIATNGFEYCRQGQLIINQDLTVSSSITVYAPDLGIFAIYSLRGKGDVSVAGNIANICVDDECEDYDIEGDDLVLRYFSAVGCSVTIILRKD